MSMCVDPCGIICVILIYGCVAYADYVVCAWLIVPVFTESLWGGVHIVIFNTLLIMSLVAHARAMMTDPGVVPINKNRQRGLKHHNSSSDSDSMSDVETMILRGKSDRGDDWTMCTRCESLRPPRAHHCRVCRRCIRKMDHHCPWVNNCVGEFNQKYFLQFLFYVGLASIYSLMIVIVSWVYDDDHATTGLHGPFGEGAHHHKVLHSIFLCMESVLFGMFVLAVSCDQLNAIFSDETAVEAVQRRGRRQYKRARRRGRFELLSEVCGGDSLLMWLMPCMPSTTPREIVILPTKIEHFEV